MFWCFGVGESVTDTELHPVSVWECSLSSGIRIAMTLDISLCIPPIPESSQRWGQPLWAAACGNHIM